MIGLRPRPSERYLWRSRLLALLPEEPGFAVWLQAPYGYGKSVLAAQWATDLERDGWRTIWLAGPGERVREAMATGLGLATPSLWPDVLEALWRLPTLVVLEDLAGDEALTPLLKHVAGLVLLASRAHLNYPELPRLVTEGRLVHLRASDLAFTEPEVFALVDDPIKAYDIFKRTTGWPLPTYFAALTGEPPERQALLTGLQESLVTDDWNEMLLLAALPLLPHSDASEATKRLAEQGIVQTLELGYRLHPLAADAVLDVRHEEARAAVRQLAPRLPPLLRGEAFARAGLLDELSELLESPEEELGRKSSSQVAAWDALLPLPRRPGRAEQVGVAKCLQGEVEDGVRVLLEVAEDETADADRRLRCYAQAAWYLTPFDRAGAERLVRAGEALLTEAGDETAGRFLHNAFRPYFHYGDWPMAEEYLRRALSRYPSSSGRRAVSLGNLAIVRWHRLGDLEGLLAGRERMLEVNERHHPLNVPGDHLQLGELKLFLGRNSEALAHFKAARRWAHAAPRWAIEAEAAEAFLEDDAFAFARILARAETFKEARLEDRIRFFWARALRIRGDCAAALELTKEATGPWSNLERALALLELGSKDRALEALPEEPGESSDRELRVYWHAACYQITQNGKALDALLQSTLSRERILPGLVSLERLPRERAGLGAAYPIEQVLASGWKEAVRLRLAEIPPLQVWVLGEFTVRAVGKETSLSNRLRGIMALLVLKRSREEIGEAIWPEADEDKVRNNLHVNMNLLRKALEPWGVRTYLGDDRLTRAQVDLWELQEALTARDADSVLKLFKLPIFPGVDLPLVDEASDALKERVVRLLVTESERLPIDRALNCLERVLELDPLNEDALQQCLTLLVSRGRKREASRRFQEFSERLNAETGLRPLAQTQRILE